jgi:hypothetical protein
MNQYDDHFTSLIQLVMNKDPALFIEHSLYCAAESKTENA